MLQNDESQKNDSHPKSDGQRHIEIHASLQKGTLHLMANAASQAGLSNIKTHSPKHASWYIKHYGYSDNFFGGNLENALKSTIKAPFKRMSRRHDHLCHELSNR